MIKKIMFILTLTIGFSVNSQETVEKTIGEFTTVKIYDLINLKLIKSNENKVIISGKNRKEVEIVNKNGPQRKLRR